MRQRIQDSTGRGESSWFHVLDFAWGALWLPFVAVILALLFGDPSAWMLAPR